MSWSKKFLMKVDFSNVLFADMTTALKNCCLKRNLEKISLKMFFGPPESFDCRNLSGFSESYVLTVSHYLPPVLSSQ